VTYSTESKIVCTPKKSVESATSVQYHGAEHLRRGDLLCFGNCIHFVAARVNSCCHVVCRKIISNIDLAEEHVP
jgi:hypothetical protein